MRGCPLKVSDHAAALLQLKQACKEIAPGIPPRIEGMGTSHHANSEWLVSASHTCPALPCMSD